MLECGPLDLREDSNNTYAQIAIPAQKDKNVFPLKMRDNGIHVDRTRALPEMGCQSGEEEAVCG